MCVAFMALLVSMAMSNSQFTFVIPDKDLLSNCLEAQSEEVNTLKLRVAQLEYQLSLANVRAGLPIEGSESSEKSGVTAIGNPSFDCKCSNQTASFKFGYTGELVVARMLGIISHPLNIPFSSFDPLQIAQT